MTTPSGDSSNRLHSVCRFSAVVHRTHAIGRQIAYVHASPHPLLARTSQPRKPGGHPRAFDVNSDAVVGPAKRGLAGGLLAREGALPLL